MQEAGAELRPCHRAMEGNAPPAAMMMTDGARLLPFVKTRRGNETTPLLER
jgi:hypothetical protein